MLFLQWLLQFSSVTQSCLTLCYLMNCSWPGSSIHGISQARILQLSCHFLLQGIFPSQGSNPHFLHRQADSLQLSRLESPSVQFSSVAQSCPTLCDPMNRTAHQASLSITNSQSLPRLISIESVMPSNHLILCHPLLSCPHSFPTSRLA